MPPRTLSTERLTLLALSSLGPNRVWAERYADYEKRNDAHLAPFDPPRPANWGTVEDALFRFEQAASEAERGVSARWFLVRDERVIGHVSLSQIARGPFCSAMMGYSLDRGVQGQGLMHEALVAVIAFAFGELRLHRIQANYLTDNARSGRVLRRLGFQIEGEAKRYLFINGAWRDHTLSALLNDAMTTPEPR